MTTRTSIPNEVLDHVFTDRDQAANAYAVLLGLSNLGAFAPHGSFASAMKGYRGKPDTYMADAVGAYRRYHEGDEDPTDEIKAWTGDAVERVRACQAQKRPLTLRNLDAVPIVTSYSRYNGGVAVKRKHGSSTVTTFLVSFGDAPSRFLDVKGPNPSARKRAAVSYAHNPDAKFGVALFLHPVFPCVVTEGKR